MCPIPRFVFVICVLQCLFHGTGYAQPPVLNFQQVMMDGEPVNLRSIIQDSQGFMWMGIGNQGLYRYDGSEYVQWAPGELGRFTAMQLAEWPRGTLWIGTTEYGLIKLNMASGDYSVYGPDASDSTSLPISKVSAMTLDSTHRLWVATSEGMGWFDPEKEVFHRVNAAPGKSGALQSNFTLRLFTDSKGQVWVGTYNDGAYCLTDFNDGEPVFCHYGPGYEYFDGEFVIGFTEDRDHNIWIATSRDGLLKAPLSGPDCDLPFIQYTSTPSDPTTLNSNKLNCIGLDPKGRLWAGSQTGLNLYDPQTDGFHRIFENEFNPNGIMSHRLISLYNDREGNAWFQTFRGTAILSPFARPITNYFPQSKDPGSKIRGWPRSIWEDLPDHLWIGTNKGGLVHLDPTTGAQIHYMKDDGKPAGFASKHALDLHQTSDGTLWIGTAQGLARTRPDDPDGHRFYFYPHLQPFDTGNALVYRVIYEMDEDPFGRLYLGTHFGLSRFDPKTENFENLIDTSSQTTVVLGDNYFWGIDFDKAGNVWLIARDQGLRYLPKDAPFRSTSFVRILNDPDDPTGLADQYISSIHVDQNETLWVGTYAGLNRLDSMRLHPDTAFFFTLFGKEQGMAVTRVEAIEEDDQGRLWLGTQQGITRFDPHTETFHHFDKTDGLLAQKVTVNGSRKGKSGKLYWASDNGVSAFFPDSMKLNSVRPKVRLTGIRLFNKPVPVGAPEEEGGFFVNKNTPYLSHLELEHHQSVVTFTFAALNYFQPHKNQYAYKMEGFDRDWTYCGNKREATYTNLDPGTYTFRVKASNNDGFWNEKGCAISLTILPPWYQTWWAYCFYGIFFTALLGAIFYARIRKIAREYETQAKIENAKHEERERVRSRSARDFHDEAGNKLTKLSLYTELTKREVEGNENASTYMAHIESNLKDLSTGMRDFIWVLDPEKDSLPETLERIKDFGNQLFEHSDTNFAYDLNKAELEHFSLEIKVKRHLLLIFKEAMNNSLKYSNATQAHFQGFYRNKALVIEFTDNGDGFDVSKASSGNGLRNMRNRAAEIGGKLSLISAPGGGTKLVFEKEIGVEE